MPYEGEYANKASHFDIVRNPDVEEFLSECEYLTVPSQEEAADLVSVFAEPPCAADPVELPQHVIAVDGSLHETSLDERLPSTKVGYVKVGSILIRMSEYQALRVYGGRFVDPFRVAKLEERNWPLTFTLPSANVRLRGADSVRDSFRSQVDRGLHGPKTRFRADDASTSLRTTLFHLASMRPGELGTGDPTRLRVHLCPTCKVGPVELNDTADPQYCLNCGKRVYPSDCLRLWEEVDEFQSNYAAMSRFMSVVEHLLPIHYIRYLMDKSLRVLGSMAFFIDGPLANFGTSAWLHASIMRFLYQVNESLKSSHQDELLVIGLQKTGQIADHLALIERFIPNNAIYAIEDEYRYRHIITSRSASSNGFGYETYYGQDFIYKTPSGRIFVFGLPYPFQSKDAAADFVNAKADIERYASLARAVALIRNFESDLYTNAIIPIALAHRYTAISLVPGGQVLDLLTETALGAV